MLTSAVIEHKDKEDSELSEFGTMVKKIRRRVEKEAAPEETEATTQIADDGEPSGFVADLERLAEDSFTRSLVDGLKVLHQYRKLLVIGILVLLGAFVFQQLSDLTAQEKVGAKAATLDKALAALESGQGLDANDGQRGETPTSLTEEEKTAKLTAAAREFGRLEGAGALKQGGQAAANLALTNHKKAIEQYKAAFDQSGQDKLLQAIALNGEAAALEDSGQLSEAVAAWKRLGELDEEKFGTLAAVEQARILVASNRQKEARAIIDGVKTSNLSPFGLMKPQVEQLQGLLPKSTK